MGGMVRIMGELSHGTAPRELTAALSERLRELADATGVDLLVAFGSTVAGRATGASDLDLGVLARANGVLERFEHAALDAAVHPRLDVVNLSRATALLRLLVARTGAVLFERRPGEFAGFASLAMRMNEDARRYREADREAVARFTAGRHG